MKGTIAYTNKKVRVNTIRAIAGQNKNGTLRCLAYDTPLHKILGGEGQFSVSRILPFKNDVGTSPGLIYYIENISI